MIKIFVMGSLNMDLISKTDIFPDEGETVLGDEFFTNPGGKGANQAVACAKQDAKVIMLGTVGNDSYGKELIDSLKKNNVDTSCILKKESSSGIAVIILENSKNRIIVHPGANAMLYFDDYKDILKKQSKKGDYFLAQMETKLENVEKGLMYAKELGMVTILNPAPAMKISNDVLSCTDILILNETETKIMTGIYPDTEDSVDKAIDKLQQHAGKVVITLGAKGCAYKEKELQYIPIIKVDTVDTTAAGDTFIGAFTVSLSNNNSFRDSISYATLCASMTVSSYGALVSIPTKKEALAFKERLIKENYDSYNKVFK